MEGIMKEQVLHAMREAGKPVSAGDVTIASAGAAFCSKRGCF